MTRVFISQPMKGLSDAKIIVVREKLFEEFRAEHPDAVLIDSLTSKSEQDNLKDMAHPEVMLLARSIGRMADADVAIFAPGWENYTGCRVENRVARYYGIKIKYA